MSMTGILSIFAGHEAVVAAAAAKMRDQGLTPEDVLREYDDWMAEQMRHMVPANAATADAKWGTRRRPGQADEEHRLGACPVCGAEVWGIKKCPHIAPPWRTFFACDSDDCAYHGKSRLTVEALRSKWPEGAEVD